MYSLINKPTQHNDRSVVFAWWRQCVPHLTVSWTQVSLPSEMPFYTSPSVPNAQTTEHATSVAVGQIYAMSPEMHFSA